MNVLVLIKEVPEMEKVKFDTERGVVNRTSARAEMNPFDLYALQAAVDLKEKADVHITAVTMGPMTATGTLRDCWARGADHCVLLSDRVFAGSDTYATAKVLSAAIQTMKFDLILCGEKSVDGDTAQVGAEVAELLNLPHTYYAGQIKEVDQKAVTVVANGIAGASQTRRMSLPALVSVDKGIAVPKLPGLERKLDSLKTEIEILNLDSISGIASAEEVGLKGSPTKVAKVVVPKIQTRSSIVFRDDLEGFADAVAACLEEVAEL